MKTPTARHLRTRDHAAAAHEQVVDRALLPVQVAHELAGRQLLLVASRSAICGRRGRAREWSTRGPDWPTSMRPRCRRRASTAARSDRFPSHARHAERVRDRLAARHHARQDVLAEVVIRIGRRDVFFEQLIQVLRAEHVDAHARERDVRACPASRADPRAFRGKPVTRRCSSTCITPNAIGFHARHLDTADRAVRAAFDVVEHHARVVHLVDVVARQHDDVFRAGSTG